MDNGKVEAHRGPGRNTVFTDTIPLRYAFPLYAAFTQCLFCFTNLVLQNFIFP